MEYVFRYSFPVPRHGALRSVELYVTSDHNPRLSEVREIVGENKRTAEQEKNWAQAKDWEIALYALDHLQAKEFPLLPISGSIFGCPVFCETPDGKLNSIQVSLIKPRMLVASQPQYRQAKGM